MDNHLIPRDVGDRYLRSQMCVTGDALRLRRPDRYCHLFERDEAVRPPSQDPWSLELKIHTNSDLGYPLRALLLHAGDKSNESA